MLYYFTLVFLSYAMQFKQPVQGSVHVWATHLLMYMTKPIFDSTNITGWQFLFFKTIWSKFSVSKSKLSLFYSSNFTSIQLFYVMQFNLISKVSVHNQVTQTLTYVTLLLAIFISSRLSDASFHSLKV